MVSILVKDLITSRLRGASVVAACNATSIETKYSNLPNSDSQFKLAMYRTMENAATAVVMSVAVTEATINELLSSAEERQVHSPWIRAQNNISAAVLKKWADIWSSEERMTLIEKCQTMLKAANLQPLPEGKGSLQHLAVLIDLRNELVHSKPVYRAHGRSVPQKDRDPLERKLTGKFKPSLLVPKNHPFIWERCLSMGCAQWAVRTQLEFRNDLFRRLGINSIAEVPDFNVLPEMPNALSGDAP